MSLIQPLGLAFLALIPIVIAFYILKLRRQNVQVSSTLLWDQVLRDLSANHPWQRLRRNLLLLLQLLAMLLVIFALARPYMLVQAQAGGTSMVVLLDASASMNATDVAPNRLEVAKRQVTQLIDDLADGQQMTLIRVAGTPQVLVSASDDKTALRNALTSIGPSGSLTNLTDALSLAASLSRQRPNTEIVLVSDGNLSDADSVQALGQLPTRVRYIPIGAPSVAGSPIANQGITAFVARLSPERIGEYEVYVRVTNYSDKAVKLNLAIEADGTLAQAKTIEVPGRQSVEETLADFPLGVRLMHARINGNEAGDQLPTDNDAWALTTAGAQHKVLMVTNSNQFLERALTVLPGIDLWKVSPGGLITSTTAAERYDVTILDGVIPEKLPEGNLLIFNPPANNKLVEVNGELQQPRVTDWRRTDPLLRYIDLGNVAISKAPSINPPGWSRVLVESDRNPLVVAGTYDNRRIVIVSFDLHNSNLPLQLPYPLLMANIIGWLTSGGAITAPGLDEADQTLKAGNPITVQPAPKADHVLIEKPDKTSIMLPAGGNQKLIFADTDRPGVYTIVHKAGNTELDRQYTIVNLNDERESNIAVQSSVAIGSQQLTTAADAEVAREIWFWLALAALAFVMFEWWWYHRRG